MDANLEIMATLGGWMCSDCHQFFDAMWRPTKKEKAWFPPITYQWTADKPPFRYCPMCGARFIKEPTYGDEIRTE